MDAISRGKLRRVRTAPGREDEIYEALRGLSGRCQDNMIALADELATAEPEPEDRCGVLDGRYEVFALRAAGCGRARMIVTVDTGRKGCPVAIHGIVRGEPCEAGRALAAQDLKLRSGTWET